MDYESAALTAELRAREFYVYRCLTGARLRLFRCFELCCLPVPKCHSYCTQSAAVLGRLLTTKGPGQSSDQSPQNSQNLRRQLQPDARRHQQ